VPADQVILGNSTTYGLHLLVQGVDWREGDEVLLVDGDFPATIVPWSPLAERGVRVRLLRPEGGAPDALVSCGVKWLCGPYGTGFCWLRPDLLASLTYRPAYWLGHLAQDDLGQEAAIRLRDDLGAAAYDVFGTANFLNFRPWTASVEYLLGSASTGSPPSTRP
jgi:selenocysteine lyase/cysteine desulfurase